jgi:hypothetical protein
MTIKRATPGENPFTVILNEVINDGRLGADGLGVLVYLISKPVDWEVKIGDLRRQFGIGRDKATKIMGHLVDLGYAERYQGREDTGSFGSNNYLIFDRIRPFTENPSTVEPSTAKPALQRKEKKQNTDSYSAVFEEQVWAPYPRKTGTSKKKAWDLFRMLNEENQAKVIATIPAYAEQMRREGRSDDKIKHLQFWLSDRIYETLAASPARAGGSAEPWYRTATRDQWARLLKIYSGTNSWSQQWGPEIDKPGCTVPEDLVLEFKIKCRGHLFSPAQIAEMQASLDRLKATAE